MTPQEAIDIVNDITWFDNGRHYGKIEPARDLAVSALEKQIPKKPIEDGYYDKPCVCPYCGQGLNYIECEKYCKNCGQAIDWSDT